MSSRTSENVELSQSYLIFMTLAMLIASVGIYFNQPILIVAAMVVGPDFGPIAGICVALVNRNRELVRRSGAPLVVGFAVGIAVTYLSTVILRAVGQLPGELDFDAHHARQLHLRAELLLRLRGDSRRNRRDAQPDHREVERPRSAS